jgi:peptide-methionine (S)-S-oxide reductase
MGEITMTRLATRLARAAALSVAACAAPAAAFAQAGPPPEGLRSAVFAGGCFWCVEADFDAVDGVVETLSGYTGGSVENPTYGDVTGGGTGHREAVRILYDPDRVSYETLADAFFRTIDPTDGGGQFCDRGPSYSTAIYAQNDEQRRIAEAAASEAAETLDAEIETEIAPAAPFWPAEDYHQDYYEKNPIQYRFYRATCGRDRRVRDLWGQDAKEALAPLS